MILHGIRNSKFMDKKQKAHSHEMRATLRTLRGFGHITSGYLAPHLAGASTQIALSGNFAYPQNVIPHRIFE